MSDAKIAQPLEDSANDRLAGERYGRFGANVGKWTETEASTCSENQSGIRTGELSHRKLEESRSWIDWQNDRVEVQRAA
jgi:hypothetical protein